MIRDGYVYPKQKKNDGYLRRWFYISEKRKKKIECLSNLKDETKSEIVHPQPTGNRTRDILRTTFISRDKTERILSIDHDNGRGIDLLERDNDNTDGH